MKKKGFTLIELIAVIAILAILAIIAVPRVITYVDRSKKVAIQTEATTIYNAAEAAYNDGKFKVTKYNAAEAVYNDGVAFKTEHFEGFDVIALVGVLEKEGLLSNVNMDKFENFHHKRGDKKPIITLRDLKTIMNAKTDDINVDSQGVLQKVPEIKSTTAQQQINNSSTTDQQQFNNRSTTVQQQLNNRSTTDQQQFNNRIKQNKNKLIVYEY